MTSLSPFAIFKRFFASALALAVALISQSYGQEPDSNTPDTPGNESVEAAARIREAILRIDPSVQYTENSAQFFVAGVPVLLVYDLAADRMRLMSPAADANAMSEEDLMRLMQANFESALDARYAIAQDTVWATFIHSLSPLGNDEFASGLGQVVNLVLTFGESYNSGALIYGGGDNNDNSGRDLIEELEEKTNDI